METATLIEPLASFHRRTMRPFTQTLLALGLVVFCIGIVGCSSEDNTVIEANGPYQPTERDQAINDRIAREQAGEQ